MKFGAVSLEFGQRNKLTHELEVFLEQPRSLALLGSTGSIGTQGLDVVRHVCALAEVPVDSKLAPLRVLALSAGARSLDLLAEQAVEFGVELVATSGNHESLEDLRQLISDKALAAQKYSYAPVLVAGDDASVQAAQVGADVVLNGITGSIGLRPTLAALQAGSQVALANKESLIAGGELVRRAVEASPLAQPLIPVDSEHSALAQALAAGSDQEIDRLVLTASGGPFRGMPRAALHEVTPAQALAHPTWDMGLVVTTNSATMVNKALEVLEAHHLFGVDLDRIDVTVHPQSMVHSMVQFVDGSTIAQASPPTMLLPIALGLTWPHRISGIAAPCDWAQSGSWTFEPLDHDAFPAVNMIKEAGKRAGTFPAVFNAVNEEAVAAFHAGKIRFTDIVETVHKVLGEHENSGAYTASQDLSLEAVMHAEESSRIRAQEILG